MEMAMNTHNVPRHTQKNVKDHFDMIEFKSYLQLYTAEKRE